MNEYFSDAVLAWFDQHGRTDLPWQQGITPYRVWVSEIMLQQTQVATVRGYFLRFMERFPTAQALAEASEDDVLHQWTGLGYYSRARNLHQAARQVMERFGGEFPAQQAELESLPGIGRSTAAAIVSIAFGQPAAILDGNVKRVLARYYGVSGWPGQTAVQKQLWAKAEQLVPTQRCGDYTQAMMDLGATLCTRAKPACGLCPLMPRCVACAEGKTREIPASKPRKTLPLRMAYTAILLNEKREVLLVKRPPTGVWGGLWSLPEVEADSEQAACLAFAAAYGLTLHAPQVTPPHTHTFSHYRLQLTPLIAEATGASGLRDSAPSLWYDPQQPLKLGLAAPVKKWLPGLLTTLETTP